TSRIQFFCMSMQRTTPVSTIFPYTTLFRSRSGEGSRESDPVQGGATDSKERRTFRTARMGRKLSGERGVGGAFRFPDQDPREDCTRTQNRVALLRKARPSGNDL